MRIATIATGIGNVRSVVRAFEVAAADIGAAKVVSTADPDVIRKADVLVVPGQGSFGAFAAAIAGGLRDALLERVRAGTPYFGICLGMQILFETSDEAPDALGLGVLHGRVRRLTPGVDTKSGRPFPLPHMGWNRADVVTGHFPLVQSSDYYFAHSYVVAPSDEGVVSSTTTYGGDTFASSVQKDNVVGVQFHPEKSQRAGLSLTARFLAWLAKPEAG